METRYNKVLQELSIEFELLMLRYLRKLHEAYNIDCGQKKSHTDIIAMMIQDCPSIFSNNLDKIAIDNQSEKETITIADPIWGEYELPIKGNEIYLSGPNRVKKAK